MDLPPVLNLQLKRFEYDFQRDTMVKVGGPGHGWWLVAGSPTQIASCAACRTAYALQRYATGRWHWSSALTADAALPLQPSAPPRPPPTAAHSLPLPPHPHPLHPCLAPPPLQINDRYEFGEDLDLDVGDGKYLAPTADRSVRNLYKLHSVLVHSGGVHGGHYYAFIRPDCKTWLKFDDERVSKEDRSKALDEQYGGGGGRG